VERFQLRCKPHQFRGGVINRVSQAGLSCCFPIAFGRAVGFPRRADLRSPTSPRCTAEPPHAGLIRLSPIHRRGEFVRGGGGWPSLLGSGRRIVGRQANRSHQTRPRRLAANDLGFRQPTKSIKRRRSVMTPRSRNPNVWPCSICTFIRYSAGGGPRRRPRTQRDPFTSIRLAAIVFANRGPTGSFPPRATNRFNPSESTRWSGNRSRRSHPRCELRIAWETRTMSGNFLVGTGGKSIAAAPRDHDRSRPNTHTFPARCSRIKSASVACNPSSADRPHRRGAQSKLTRGSTFPRPRGESVHHPNQEQDGS